MTKLFIVGFPRNIAEVALVELFSVYGIVENITLITDKDTGKRKGFGFINMMDQAGAERAISALNGLDLEGRQISVRLADLKPGEPLKNDQVPTFDSNPNKGGSGKALKRKRPRL